MSADIEIMRAAAMGRGRKHRGNHSTLGEVTRRSIIVAERLAMLQDEPTKSVPLSLSMQCDGATNVTCVSSSKNPSAAAAAATMIITTRDP